MEKLFMKKLLFLVPLCIIIVELLAACGSTSANTGTTSTSTAGNTPPARPQHFKVGDTVTVGSNWKVVVNGIATNAGDDFSKPQKGVFVVVNVSLTNISNQEQNVSSILNFKFKGSDGTAYTETYLQGAAPSPNGKVAVGDVTKGDLVYDVPADQKAFTLSFAPDITSAGQTIWNLNLP
jgi:hypothetical protein